MGNEFPFQAPAPSMIEELAEEVFRKVKMKARAAAAPDAVSLPPSLDCNLSLARQIVHRRRCREQLLGSDMFHDPVWDMMLDLFINAESLRQVSVSSLCIAANVPATTALRHIALMQQKGVVERRQDPHDNRRAFIILTPEWHAKLDQLLTSWRSAGALAA